MVVCRSGGRGWRSYTGVSPAWELPLVGRLGEAWNSRTPLAWTIRGLGVSLLLALGSSPEWAKPRKGLREAPSAASRARSRDRRGTPPAENTRKSQEQVRYCFQISGQV